MYRPFLASLAAISILSLGCSSSSGSSSGGAGGLSFSFTTAPAMEMHWCQYAKVPYDDSGQVVLTGHSSRWGAGIHHLLVTRTLPGLPPDVDLQTPFDCFQPGASQYMGASLFLDQSAVDADFPAGTGYALSSDEVIIVQAHVVNTSASPLTSTLQLDLKTGAPSTVPNLLGLIQFYDPYIVVPAHATGTASMRCPIPQDMTVFGTTTHFHTRGVDAKVFFDPASGQPTTAPIVESTSWDHPSVTAAPSSLKAGSFVRTQCTYHGDDNDAYQGADKLNDEMCMAIAYYYPRVSADQQAFFENCASGDEYGSGTAACGATLGCTSACASSDAPHYHDGQIDVGACWQKCMVGSCPSASAPFGAVSACIQKSCSMECSTMGSACTTCLGANCGAELGACTSHTCP
jgi:hypothetical protein